MQKQILLICLMIVPFLSMAQEEYWVKINRIDQDPVDPANVIIEYQLYSKEPDALYTVDLDILFSSGERRRLTAFDQGSQIGPDQKPGTNKRVIWQAANEISSFDQSVNFIISAEQTYTPIRFINPSPFGGQKFKVGKTYQINWKGGISKEQVLVELVDSKGSASEINTDLLNDGTMDWTIGKKDVGTYKMRITHRGQSYETLEFKVARKFPIFLRVLLGVAVIGGGAFLYDQAIAPDELPDPQFPQ
ncbi:MAG: hypothetical protein R8G66_26495 [Cytophagales bacterium]|nr:hypothetical protein [Cytophagales bacterium]